MSQEVIIREAEATDASALIQFLNQSAQESNFLTLDEVGILLSQEEMEEYLAQISEKDNNAYFLAVLKEKIIGLLAVTADFHYRIRHIGEIFIAVGHSYQGQGIAGFLFEDMLDWVKEVGVLKRLELTCQKRNTKAIALYKKYGFELEAQKPLGARDENGKFIDTLQMVRLI